MIILKLFPQIKTAFNAFANRSATFTDTIFKAIGVYTAGHVLIIQLMMLGDTCSLRVQGQ